MNFQDEFTRLKIANFAKQIGAKRYNESSLITGCVLAKDSDNYVFDVQDTSRNTKNFVMVEYFKFLQREDLFLTTSIDVYNVVLQYENNQDVIEADTVGTLTQGEYTSVDRGFAKALNSQLLKEAKKGFLTISQNQEVVAKSIPLLDFYDENTPSSVFNVANDTVEKFRKLKVGEMAKTLTPYIVFSGEKSQDLAINYNKGVSSKFETNYIGVLVKFSGIIFPGRSSQLSTLESLVSASQQ